MMIRLRLVFGLIALGFAVSASTIGAANRRTEESPRDLPSRINGVDVVLSFDLEAEVGSERPFSHLSLHMLADGRRAIQGTTRHAKGRRVNRAFAFEIDPVTLRYKAYAVDPRQVEEGLGGAAMSRVPAREKRDLEQVFADDFIPGGGGEEPPPNCGEPTLCQNPCSGNWTISVSTYDPIFLQLTRTSGSASWWEMPTTCVFKSQASGACEAAAPSALGTNWFITSCSRTGGGLRNGGPNFTAQGTYINYDFQLDNLATYVVQQVSLQYSGTLNTSWSHVDSGEGSTLIFGLVSEAGSDGC